MRGWDQSDRFDEAWALVAATYHREIHVLANVVDIAPKPERKPRRKASILSGGVVGTGSDTLRLHADVRRETPAAQPT